MTVKVTVDLSDFSAFTRKAPGIMDNITKESFTRGAAKMRKEYLTTIERRRWAPLQETEAYRSKYSRPLQMLKGMIRYRVTGGAKRITATIGIFSGRVRGGGVLNNQKFRNKYGVTVNRFGKLMTYGGRLKIYEKDRRRMVKQGFYVSKRANYIRFPRRDWFTTTRWGRPTVIIPYIQKDLNERVKEKLHDKRIR